MIMILRLLVIPLALLVFGCADKTAEQEQPEAQRDETVSLQLPASFSGEIPCDDCLRVDIVLNLRPDSIYQLRKSYITEQGVGDVQSQMGRWRYSADGDLVILGKQKGLLKTYAIMDENRLRFVEWEGTDIKSQIQYDLVRRLEVDPFRDVVKMRGMFQVEEDAVRFTECSSNGEFQLSRAGEFDLAAQAYMNIPHFFGRPVLMSMLGRLSDERGVEMVVIEKFNRFYPTKDCEGGQTGAVLTGTYWQLIELDGAGLELDENQSAPYLIFEQDKSLAGFGGCNDITGSYLVQGDVFLVNRDSAARIACPGAMELENKLLEALDSTEVYRIDGEVFELVDQFNTTRARFQAGP